MELCSYPLTWQGPKQPSLVEFENSSLSGFELICVRPSEKFDASYGYHCNKPNSLVVKSPNKKILFLGKGDVLTYWLLGACESNPVKRKLPDISKLKPLFRLPKTGIPPGSQEVSLTNFFNL